MRVVVSALCGMLIGLGACSSTPTSVPEDVLPPAVEAQQPSSTEQAPAQDETQQDTRTSSSEPINLNFQGSSEDDPTEGPVIESSDSVIRQKEEGKRQAELAGEIKESCMALLTETCLGKLPCMKTERPECQVHFAQPKPKE